MAQTTRLAELGQRRALLVSRSSEFRQELAQDFSSLESSCIWIDRGYSLMKSGRVLWPWVAGLAGFALASGKTGWLGKTQKLWSAVKIGKRVLSALRIMRA
jgi:hypothetical protein